jgi:hypothetical protein
MFYSFDYTIKSRGVCNWLLIITDYQSLYYPITHHPCFQLWLYISSAIMVHRYQLRRWHCRHFFATYFMYLYHFISIDLQSSRLCNSLYYKTYIKALYKALYIETLYKLGRRYLLLNRKRLLLNRRHPLLNKRCLLLSGRHLLLGRRRLLLSKRRLLLSKRRPLLNKRRLLLNTGVLYYIA